MDWWSGIVRPCGCQGFTTLTPQPSKSSTLRVATVAPVAHAIAAICASNCEMGRPARRRSVAILA